MERMSRALLGAALGLTLVPGLCRAGQITWGYSSTLEAPITANGEGYIRAGDSFDGTHDVAIFGRLEAAPGQSGLADSATVVVGEGSFSGPGAFLPNLGDNWYTYRLTLTDAASGENGVLSVSGTLRASDHFNPGGRISNDFTSPTSGSLLLGDNRYRAVFTFRTFGHNDGFPEVGVDAIVTVSEVQPMPEPSTLLLACVGLACTSLAARRRVRRILPA
jgi:PEP-CTERM motif